MHILARFIYAVSPLARYDALTASGGPVRADEHQRHIVEELDQLWHELQHYNPPEIKGTAQSGAAATNKNQDENLFRAVRKKKFILIQG